MIQKEDKQSSVWPHWRDYLELCKPKVVALMILTSLVGMFLASASFVSWRILLAGNLGISLFAFSAAAINHLADRHIDKKMRRTEDRPLAKERISVGGTISFAIILALSGAFILVFYVNLLTAVLSFLTTVVYAGVYTLYLKHATPQNIVIGGIAGAAPPLLGWVAVTGHIDPTALLLVLIIFVWTPPHFWALAIHRVDDYAKAKVPMLPNVYGVAYTKLCVFLYTCLLVSATLLPFAIHSFGLIYLVGSSILNVRFLYWSWRLLRSDDIKVPMRVFRFSITYLMLLFVVMLVDHCLMV